MTDDRVNIITFERIAGKLMARAILEDGTVLYGEVISNDVFPTVERGAQDNWPATIEIKWDTNENT